MERRDYSYNVVAPFVLLEKIGGTMANHKMGRINEDVQRELSVLIPNVKDPRVRGMISVTAVETTPDLRYAKVFISILDKQDTKEVLKGLKSASGWLRRELGNALKLRYTPELSFEMDDSIDKGAHILELLRSVDKKYEKEERDDT